MPPNIKALSMEAENFTQIDPAKAMKLLIDNTHDLARDGYIADVISEVIEDDGPNLYNILVDLGEKEISACGYMRNQFFLKSIAIAYISPSTPYRAYIKDFDDSCTASDTVCGSATQAAEALIRHVTMKSLEELAGRISAKYNHAQYQEALPYSP